MGGLVSKVNPTAVANNNFILAGYDIRNFITPQKTNLNKGRRNSTSPTPGQGNEWDQKIIKTLILERKISPFLPPFEDITSKNDLEECPICFLYYPGGLNRAICCKKGLCSECFIQVKKSTTYEVSCPFCNQQHYAVYYTGPLTKEEKEKEILEEQKVIELKMKIQKEENTPTNDKTQETKDGQSANISIVNNKELSPDEVFHQSFQEKLKKLSLSPSPEALGIKIPEPRASYPSRPKPGQSWAQLEEELLQEAISLSLIEQNSLSEEKQESQKLSDERSNTSNLRSDDDASNEFSPLPNSAPIALLNTSTEKILRGASKDELRIIPPRKRTHKKEKENDESDYSNSDSETDSKKK